MNNVIYNIALQLDEIKDSVTTLTVMQSDNLTRIVRATFYDRDSVEMIDKDAVVKLVVSRPDGEVLWLDCSTSSSAGQTDYYDTAECSITADMISVPGSGMGQFMICNADMTEIIRSQKFPIKIGEKLDDVGAEEGDPESGAMRGQSWKEILNITTEEELKEIYFDLTGYTKFYIYAELKPNAAGDGSWFRLYPTGSDMLYTHGADIGKVKRYYSLCFEKIDVFHPVFLYTSTSSTAFYENSAALSGGANPRLSEIGEIKISTYKPIGVGSVIRIYAMR